MNLATLSRPDLERLVRARALAELQRRESSSSQYNWDRLARPSQLLPPDVMPGGLRWQYWLIQAGRGFGKTRVGAETTRKWVKRYRYVNLIGATADDARDIMIEGESGILAVCPPSERPIYRASKRRLEWPNGARSLIFTADEPERLRGKQHEKLWADELGAWRYEDSWDQAMFGLRLGDNPQAVITTTPRPTKLIKDLVKNPHTYITRGSTYENKANLAPAFLNAIIKKYENTRLGRQELDAELLEDNPNALFHQSNIEKNRVKVAPAMKRIVVALDPSVTSKDTSDEWGIIIAGLGVDDRGYILRDRSRIVTPAGGAEIAVDEYRALSADRIIGEANNGGDMLEALIRNVDKNASYKKVIASRGKTIRAEPISALYEQDRISHVGLLAKLEDEMCSFDPGDETQASPNRMDALVWALTELFGISTTGLLDFYAGEAGKGNKK